jgi:hypothetical protein
MTRRTEATVRRPGTRIAPVISTSTCRQVGALNPVLKGSIHATSALGTSCSPASGMRDPRIDVSGERLDNVGADANPLRHHVRFKSRRIQQCFNSAKIVIRRRPRAITACRRRPTALWQMAKVELMTPLINPLRHYTRPRVRENNGCWSSRRVNTSISGRNQRSGIVGIRS